MQKRADKNQVTPLYASIKNDIPVADCKTGIFTIIFTISRKIKLNVKLDLYIASTASAQTPKNIVNI